MFGVQHLLHDAALHARQTHRRRARRRLRRAEGGSEVQDDHGRDEEGGGKRHGRVAQGVRWPFGAQPKPIFKIELIYVFLKTIELIDTQIIAIVY